MSEHHYTCYGLQLRSAFPCPELRTAQSNPEPHLTIHEGPTPDQIPSAVRRSARFEIAPGELLLTVDGIARFWVRNGSEIIMQRAPGASLDDARVFLYGTAFGAAILQQGHVPLHATTVSKAGKSIAIAGPSGVGKSTLAYTLLQRGWDLVCDDVSALEIRDGSVLVHSGIPSVKLWRDVLEASRVDCAALNPIRLQIDKFRWDASQRFHEAPATLHAVVGLATHNENSISAEPILGTRKFRFLASQTYRRQMINGMAQRDRIFNVWSEALQNVSFWRVRRPKWPLDPDRLADAVENLFA